MASASVSIWKSAMSLLVVLLIVLLLVGGIGAYPSWSYSAGWGYGPSSLIGLLLVVLIVMALLGRSPI
jgi:hypothetical protein